MFLKWFSRIFHQKVFNKRIHQMVKNALHKFFRMIFMRSQKLTSNNFDDLTWQKKMERKKTLSVVPLSSSFSCFINKITSVQNKFPRWTSKCINFFLPQIFFPFPKFVICWLHIGERKPFVSKQLFWWRSKNHNKTPPNSEKKNDLVKCKVFPSNKSGLVKCNVFCHTKKFLFFFHAGFVWMIELVKKKCFVLSTRFPLSKTALFLPKLHSVLKKKGLKAKVVSVFCVIEPFNRL